eukprot:Phypoly_transcript_02004.p1 GENE.Phypoly_transcript_02004~~Phypoly_transcript_02004.p1  ORF type:complete len:496 (+),score=54.29 Phypoly_transcript_02004:1101-2588(+)
MILIDHPFVQLVSYEVCRSKDEVETMFFQVKAQHGEGIILRNPNAAYMHGYSTQIYKHKGYRDAEAEVLKSITNNIFLCRVNRIQQMHEVRNGIEFTQEIQLASTQPDPTSPKTTSSFCEVEMTVDWSSFDGLPEHIVPGAFVSFRYTAWFGSMPPLNPKIYLVRDDIQSWDHILHSKHKPLAQKMWKTYNTNQSSTFSTPHDLKVFFDEFAKGKCFDPLLTENWYTISQKDLLIRTPNNLYKDLSNAYPMLSFSPERFARIHKNYWHDKENRKKFFDQYAHEKGFDPLSAESWYSVPKSNILQQSKAVGVLKHYKGSIISALCDIYSFVEFDADKFVYPPKKHREDSKYKLHIISEFAKQKDFDPLVASNWYKIKTSDFETMKGGPGLLQQYGGFSKTLINLLPNIGLDSSFFHKPPQYWTSAANQKQFFDTFAAERNFDPLIPNNWYQYSYKHVCNVKGGSTILEYHNQSFIKALREAYPNIVLEDHKLKKVP